MSVQDLPAAGRPVVLVWSNRLWRCPTKPRLCLRRTWSETQRTDPAAVGPDRAGGWALVEVGWDGESVAAVARQLGVGWHTGVRGGNHGQPLVDDPNRFDGVCRLGVDEPVWAHTGPKRRPGYAAGVVDISPGRRPRLLDVVPGRTGWVYAAWVTGRKQKRRDGIRLAAFDPFRGYATALADTLPSAVRVLDAFYVVKLGLDLLDQVRRRLRRGAEHLTEAHRTRLDAALTTGDPTGEVTLAWQVAQDLRALYHAPTAQQGRRRARRLIQVLPGPGSRLAGLDPAQLAGGAARLLRHCWRLQQTHRGDESPR